MSGCRGELPFCGLDHIHRFVGFAYEVAIYSEFDHGGEDVVGYIWVCWDEFCCLTLGHQLGAAVNSI